MTTETNLPDLAPDTVKGILERLTNRGTCPDLDPAHRAVCTRLTEPDLRTVDALVCRELAVLGKTNVYESDLQKGQYLFTIPEQEEDIEYVVPYYCTQWAHGGPLLEQMKCEWNVRVKWNAEEGGWCVQAGRDCGRDEYIYQTSLIGIACTWLILKVRAGKET